MRVTVWNTGAEELWGLRREEVVGEHLLNLDIGLPVEQLRPALRTVTNDGASPAEQQVKSVNRRGRTVDVRVLVNALRRTDGTVTGTVLVME